MNVTDKLYTEWAWRSKTGTPSMDNPEDKAILNKLIKELTEETEKASGKQQLIDLIQSTELSDDQIGRIRKGIVNIGYKDDILSKLANK